MRGTALALFMVVGLTYFGTTGDIGSTLVFGFLLVAHEIRVWS